jgi:hypoxanthine phosphoribosyltransferase
LKKIILHDKIFVRYISASRIRESVKAIASLLQNEYENKNPVFFSVLNGSFIFAADLLREINFTCEVDFIKVSSYQKQKSSGKIISEIGLRTDIKGRHVVILEDIADTGATLKYLLADLKKLKPASLKIAALLVKSEVLKEKVKIDYAGIRIPDRFVVGYGLDYDELGRNLKDIYQLKIKN